VKITKSMIKNQEPAPSVTMPRYWWEVIAAIYDLSERRRKQAMVNGIVPYTSRSKTSVRNTLWRLMDVGLVDDDTDTENGHTRFYVLTDCGYQLLEQFDRAVNSPEAAEQFFSPRFIRHRAMEALSAWDGVGERSPV